jgi:orotate phosphoribosyltransferase
MADAQSLALARTLMRIGAVEIRPERTQWFTWSSGARAPIYTDNRLVISDPEARAEVARGLVAAVKTHFSAAQVIAGTATAGIPHAAWVADRLGLPMVYVRGKPKEHGQGKQVEGRPLRGERVVLVEDLVSFGGSAASAVEGLRKEGGDVIGVVAIVSYGFAAAQARMQQLGVRCEALVSYDDLLEALDGAAGFDASTLRALRDWRASV